MDNRFDDFLFDSSLLGNVIVPPLSPTVPSSSSINNNISTQQQQQQSMTSPLKSNKQLQHVFNSEHTFNHGMKLNNMSTASSFNDMNGSYYGSNDGFNGLIGGAASHDSISVYDSMRHIDSTASLASGFGHFGLGIKQDNGSMVGDSNGGLGSMTINPFIMNGAGIVPTNQTNYGNKRQYNLGNNNRDDNDDNDDDGEEYGESDDYSDDDENESSEQGGGLGTQRKKKKRTDQHNDGSGDSSINYNLKYQKQLEQVLAQVPQSLEGLLQSETASACIELLKEPVKKKPGRKPKDSQQRFIIPDGFILSKEGELIPVQDKKEERKLKNREAADESRKKIRERTMALEQFSLKLRKENELLKQYVHDLENNII